MAQASAQAAKRLLLVDDDAELLEGMAVFLARALGCVVDPFVDGAAALVHANNVPYACAVLDMDMPGLNGIQVARALRDLQPNLAILFLTGSARTFAPEEIEAVARLGLVAKPVKLAVLADLLRPALQST